ncbi:MAG: hotdog family protein [Pseudomonadales bacterium]|nr:hotdog family protein [Pseudomonadales bacterium]
MKNLYAVTELVPHSGKMSLLDRVTEYGEEWLQAEVTITKHSMFLAKQGVPGWVGLEYMAQTIAAFAGLQERLSDGPPKLGFLVGSRRYSCSQEYFPVGQTLRLRVEREMETKAGLNVFQCSLQGDGVEASARLNVFQPDDAAKFLQESSE